MEYLISLRDPKNPAALGPARYFTFTNADDEKEIRSPSTWVNKLIASFPAGTDNPTGHPNRTGDILFLVHGFNVDHQSAMDFHMKCVHQLQAQKWYGQVVSFDWPSNGLVFAYVPDRFNARAAASSLVSGAIALLEAAQKNPANPCTLNVHVLAHSMGAFVVQQAFTWSYQDVPADWKVGQLMFASADVDYTVFESGNPSTTAFQQHAGRLTAYCNPYDKALLISNAKRLELAPRMGRVGLPDAAPPLMCEVNCNALFEKISPNDLANLSPVLTHCFYFDQPEFWRDVVLTLGGGIDRNIFPTRNTDPDNSLANRFQLKPAGITDADYQKALAQAATTPSIRFT
jgi:esterase/lipase superfamily enzyme